MKMSVENNIYIKLTFYKHVVPVVPAIYLTRKVPYFKSVTKEYVFGFLIPHTDSSSEISYNFLGIFF